MSLKAGRCQPIKVPPRLEVKLTDVEDQICTLVHDCTTQLQQEKGVETTCRIAGGWVRDKLLGLESNDIDIALSDIMGVPFAEYFVAFAKDKGVPTSEVAKISMNPEQSKHLETATFRVLDRMIDVVNLRSEEYSDNSRIPNQVTFGTPLQDALRRDITINTLFYNIHTRTVEDFTEKGLDDLRSGLIRTPLPPTETFHDDPLRVVRCIRFASRFGFDMVPEVEVAASDPVTHDALRSKVSRERIGEEITKMMKGRDPLDAMRHIHKFNLYPSIFAVLPPEITGSLSDRSTNSVNALKAVTILHSLLEQPSSSKLCPIHSTLLSRLTADPTCRPRLFLASALTPYRDVTYLDRKGKSVPAVDAAIRESLKLGAQNHFLDGIPALFAACKLLRNPSLDDERLKTPSERVAIGLLLRDKVVHNAITGSHWSSSLLFSLVQELVPLYDVDADNFDVDAATRVISTYNALTERILALELPQAVDARPLLDGKEVSTALNKGPGAWMGPVLARIVEWQLEHPGKSKADCIQWLQDEHKAGTLGVPTQALEPISKKLRTKK